MKTSRASLLALLLFGICSFLSGCLIHYHYQANVIEIQLRPSDDPRKIWSAIDDVAEGLGYEAKAGESSRDFGGFETYVHPGYWKTVRSLSTSIKSLVSSGSKNGSPGTAQTRRASTSILG
jgi:hypothetical protein